MVLAILFIYALPVSGWLFVILLLGWAVSWGYVFNKKLQKLWFFVTLVILACFTWGILHLNPVQNWLISKVTSTLSKNLKTKVSIRHVDLNLFNKMLIRGVLVEDQKKDTLLYAGTAKLNITDWFFFKEKPIIQYIGLTNATINMNRTDSVWNYQFLVDYFSSPKKDTVTKKDVLQIDLKVLELKNIVFNKIDKWVGQDMHASIKKLDLSADEINFSKKIVAINNASFDEPVFLISDYSGNRPKRENISATIINVSDSGQLMWNTGDWRLSVKNILLKNGTFGSEKETERAPYTDRFDGQHLQFSKINGSLRNVLFSRDTVTAGIKLSTQEKSGFTVNELTAKMKLTPEIMEFNDLDIATDKSRIGNYYSMRYRDFNSDMNDFLHAVKLEGKFDKSHIHSDDIAFFAPELKTWNRVLYFEGEAKGAVDNLSAKKMLIKSGNTSVEGDISMRGLPDAFNTFIDFDSKDLRTNYNDLVQLVPSLADIKQPRLSQLGDIRFKGKFTGFIKDFVAYGNINTSLGNLNADLNMKLRDDQVPTYSGKISSTGFNLHRFFNTSQLGNVALNGQVKGRGFNLKDLNADFNGKIQKLDFSGYTYQDITLNGTFIKNIFNGSLDINDPNLVIENLNGSVSLLGDTTRFNFAANLRKANLQKLHFTGKDFTISGLLNLNFTGNDIDNFLGTAKMYDATLKHDTTRLSFDSLSITSLKADNSKILEVQSNEIEGSLTGSFKLLELPDAFKVFLNRYYPAYIETPVHTISDQDFSFLIKTKQVDEYVQLLDKKLKGFNNSVFSGHLKSAKNDLNVNATIPEFSYDGKTFVNISLAAKGTLDSLNADISVSDVSLTDSFHLPNTRLVLNSKNDISNIQLTTSASKSLSDAQLNARVQTLTDGVKIHFFPSSFILNEKKWNLAKDGELTVRKTYLEANDVKFAQGEQEIVISTELDELTDHINLVAKLRKVNINDFTQLFIKQPRLEGIVSGKLKLRDPFGKQVVEYDGTAEEFRLDNKEIGTINLKGEVNTTSGLITAAGNADGELYKFNIDGSYNYKDSSASQMDFTFHADKFDISILDNYLGAIFTNMKGNLNTDDLKVYGGAGRQFVTGTVNITEGELKVIYTQCKYKFSNETVIFNPDEIDLGLLQLKDTLNNTGTVSGKMQHQFFQNFSFDRMRFETGKMLLLNTSKKDNSEFYGKVVGKAVMTLDGPETDMRMNITGEPSPVDSSHIYIPTSSSQEIGKIDYIDFIEYGSKMEDDFKGRRETNFLVNMNLTANPACKIDVILDEALGDVIKGNGNGQLNIRVGSKEPLTIRGNYDITDGEYKFNFQTFLQKYFAIKRGSINWNGDPYLAQINIDAEYTAEKVDLRSISPNFKQKGDLTIIAHLSGVLNKPDVSFDFSLPKEIDKDFIAEKRLEDIKSDKNQMLKQVASLLLLNTFISESESFLTGDNTLGLAANTIGQVLSNALTSTFSKFLQKALNDNTISTYFDVSSSLDLKNSASQLQGAVKVGITKSYFNNKLIISLGGNLDYNNPYLLNTNVLLTPDFTAEWLLSRDGKVRVVGFRRTNIDYTFGQRNRQGISLTYRSDFDHLSEIFAPNEEKRKRRLAAKLNEENNLPF